MKMIITRMKMILKSWKFCTKKGKYGCSFPYKVVICIVDIFGCSFCCVSFSSFQLFSVFYMYINISVLQHLCSYAGWYIQLFGGCLLVFLFFCLLWAEIQDKRNEKSLNPLLRQEKGKNSLNCISTDSSSQFKLICA